MRRFRALPREHGVSVEDTSGRNRDRSASPHDLPSVGTRIWVCAELLVLGVGVLALELFTPGTLIGLLRGVPVAPPGDRR